MRREFMPAEDQSQRLLHAFGARRHAASFFPPGRATSAGGDATAVGAGALGRSTSFTPYRRATSSMSTAFPIGARRTFIAVAAIAAWLRAVASRVRSVGGVMSHSTIVDVDAAVGPNRSEAHTGIACVMSVTARAFA